MTLPDKGPVHGELLGQTLDHTTASYKIVLVKAILRHVQAGESDFVPFDVLLHSILESIWIPVARFRLTLGQTDQLSQILDVVPEDVRLYGTFQQALPHLDLGRQTQEQIFRWPLSVFLRPWFHVAGRKPPLDVKLGRTAISSAACEIYLPYDVERDGLRLDRTFIGYVASNMALLDGWADMAFINYLQRRNPNVPAISLKLREEERPGLRNQRLFWKNAMRKTSSTCLYTGTPLNPENFHLDHFVPRRFVAHDRVWNLVPVVPEINLRKGVGVPDPGLIPSVARAHLKALEAAFDASIPKMGDMREEYLDDLGITPETFADPAAFEAAMYETLQPLVNLARKRFPDWRHP